MKKIFLAILVSAITAFGFQTISAQKSKDRMIRGGRCIKDLKLNNIQKDKFNEIRFAQKEIIIEIDAKLKKNRLEVEKIMVSKNIIESKLMKLIQNGSNLRAYIMESKTKMWLDVYNILDDEQKEKWTNHFRHMGERFMEHGNDLKFKYRP